jgi:P4 family phage/plasmid primase-like protien
MKVTEFEKQNMIKHFPIELKYNDGKLQIIGQKNGFNDFKLSDKIIDKRFERQYSFIASDTTMIQRIDVDDMELFKERFDVESLNKTPHYLSRNKRLPHYFVKLINCNVNKANIQITDDKKVVCDVLNGQWAWYKRNEQMINPYNKIIELDYNDFKKHYEKIIIPKIEQVEPTKPIIINDTKQITYSIDRVLGLLSCLAPCRYNYNDWLTVGLILYNTDKDKLFDVWNNWSKKSPTYDINELVTKWASFTTNAKSKLTIGTLDYMAKTDNKDKYDDNKFELILMNSLSGNEDDIAKVFYEMYKDDLVLAQEIPNNVWYLYDNGMWNRLNGVAEIRKLFAHDIFGKYKNMRSKLLTKIKTLDQSDDSYPEVTRQIKTINKIMMSVKTSIFVSNYIKQSGYMFKDTKFQEKLNSNRYILCFGENGFDLRSGEWRKVNRDDYCSVSVGYSMDDVNDDHIETVTNHLKDIISDEKEYEFTLNKLAELLSGDNNKEIFMLWMGAGANGKSWLTMLLKYVFGDYYAELPSKLITDKKGSANQASPEMARARYSRIVVFSEPEKSSKLNNSYMKELSGNDQQSARELYGHPFQFYPHFTCIILANEFELEDSDDYSIARRLDLISFRTQFMYDPKMSFQKLRDDEIKQREYYEKIRGSFMFLLIQTWKNLMTIKFKYETPLTLLNGKNEFIEGSNIVKTFINENIEIVDDEKQFIQLKDIYITYQIECKNKGIRPDKLSILKSRFTKHLPNFKQRYTYRINGKQIEKTNVFLNCKMINDCDDDDDNDF